MPVLSDTPNKLNAPPLGTTLAGRYHLARFLGAGGMGAVYEALTPEGHRVAVKTLFGSASQKQLARFSREAKISASLDCPHIVQTLDTGIDDALGLAFLVMPLMVGCDLSGLIKQYGVVHPTVAARIVRQACVGLQSAHDAGVIHRDIKPGNLFLDQDEHGNVTVRVLDFGVAMAPEDTAKLTQTGNMLGTPYYMSPEQIKDVRSVDCRTDVWSLGVALFKALSAQHPFEASQLTALCIAITMENPRMLQSLAPWIDPGLAAIVHACLLRDMAGRCPSASELAEALAPFAAGNDQLHVSMFQSVGPELLEYEAPRLELLQTWRRMRPQQQVPLVDEGPADPLLGRALASRYRLVRRLGEGGMGAVYQAQAADGTHYAVKIIKPELAGKNVAARQRFVREASAVASVQSEHVVRVVEADTDPQSELPFLVMEMLHGIDLGKLIERHGALRPEPVLRLFLQACNGLSAAHAQGLVHRDVKPGNLYLHQQPSGHVVVKLCDFGIVKRLGTESTETKLTATGGIIGSPVYMSPEQAKNAKNVDQRCDIWSLGVTLYQALTGQPPFKGETVGELLLAICVEPAAHIQDRAPWITPELATIVHRTLSKDMSQRFQSMDELAAALETIVGPPAPLSAADLYAVDEQIRQQVAPRASLSPDVLPGLHSQSGLEAEGVSTTAVGASSTAGFGPVSHTLEPTPPKNRSRAVVMAVAVSIMAIVGGGGYAIWRVEGARVAAAEPASEPSATGSETQSAKPSPNNEVQIAIHPPSATVSVDGNKQQLKDGPDARGRAG